MKNQTINITLLSTYLKGGAGIACNRLRNALIKSGLTPNLILQEPTKETEYVKTVSNSLLNKFISKVRLAKDVLRFAWHERSKADRFQFSIAKEGVNLSSHKSVTQADILHLHWINQGFLSIESIQKLASTGKPIVWTLHDMWAFTGGCHYSGTCLAYENHCNYCPFLKNPSSNDISYHVWERKKKLFASSNITFVTCSEWLRKLAKNSRLLQNARVETIPNAIDCNIFKPENKKETRQHFNLGHDKKIILFGAMNINDQRKGLKYLLKALEHLHQNFPETNNQIQIVTFGKAGHEIGTLFFHHVHLGNLTGQENLVKAYSLADVFVLPSLEDNLPNTVMESMACGTPVVAFDTGGIPEMIDHKRNGYLARYKSAEDLALGIHHILYNPHENYQDNSRKKVINTYSEEIIAQRYLKLYTELLQR